ncbi:alpha/beta hydrolase [Biformimicrobium ophioploci]|uniref:Esterase n=1 Tax=Biformimicrobium ophioploci TaxID=3036711 RepID=A0ABQ6M179_9GAMM|nr:alpha/beta hydrolase-fold protein [Microbulbifer sp. NKW57]GMG88051.1 hypothetical protein MNKW57_23720 [Microbulbifer sp. NKW57]
MNKLALLLLGMVVACGAAGNTSPSTSTSASTSTASNNVTVLDEAFTIPALERQRTVRLYLPPGYATSGKRYPVLYMHDGQNLFDDTTAYAGEWGVDEALDQLASENALELIVVGIDHGNDKRINELNPFANERFGAGEGEDYLAFLVGTLKPYIDRNYRTLGDREHTAIMGSSMGGHISHYAIHRYPQVFSKAGIFSPAYWTGPQIFEHSRTAQVPEDARLYLLMGSEEGEEMVENMQRMTAQLRSNGHADDVLVSRVVAGAGHNEGFWRAEFPAAVQWLFQD